MLDAPLPMLRTGILIEIDRYGERLIGCVECNCWNSSRSAFTIELSVEDFEALRLWKKIES